MLGLLYHMAPLNQTRRRGATVRVLRSARTGLRRRPIRLAVVTAVLVALMGFGIYSWHGRHEGWLAHVRSASPGTPGWPRGYDDSLDQPQSAPPTASASTPASTPASTEDRRVPAAPSGPAAPTSAPGSWSRSRARSRTRCRWRSGWRSRPQGAGLPVPLIGTGADPLVEFLELVRREAGGLAGGDDLLLVGLDLGDGLGNAAGDLGRDGHDAVLVEADDVARLDPHPADLDGDAEIDHVDVGVGDGDVRGSERELERAHIVEIADGPVGDHAHAAERAMDVRLHLAPLGALPPRLVDVVDDDDARGGDAHDE